MRRPALVLAIALIAIATARPAEAPRRLEGEDHARAGGPGKLRVLAREQALGGKVLSYWDDHGTWAEWDLDLPVAATLAITFRYASTYPTERRLEVDGAVPHPSAAALRFPATGSYTTMDLWTLADDGGEAVALALAAGRHRLRLTNVDSTGLALDAMLLHPPDQPLADQALPAAAAAAALALLPPAAGVTADAAASGGATWGLGRVMGTLEAGRLSALAVADAILRLPAAAGTPARPRRLHTANLALHHDAGGDLHRLLITDGLTAFLVLAADAPREMPPALVPEAYRRDGRVLRLATWRDARGAAVSPAMGLPAAASSWWTLGSAGVWAEPALRPVVDGTRDSLGWATPTRLAVARISPAAWRETALQPTVTWDGDRAVIRSTARRLPGLEAFYGYRDAELHLEWSAAGLHACRLVDPTSGETIAVPLGPAAP